MIKRWVIGYQRTLKYRRTVRELTALTDRDLADLGISRSDIYRVARRSIERRYAH